MEQQGREAIGIAGLTFTVLFDTLDRMGSILHDNDIPDSLTGSQLFVALVGKFAMNGIDLSKFCFLSARFPSSVFCALTSAVGPSGLQSYMTYSRSPMGQAWLLRLFKDSTRTAIAPGS